ncbi:MAG: filamentous hemagglutinin N-terminal domain-containing protein [Magnetococcales bacterium]|nr:filamentous hemagglutinin N-terminal domain-containing protein [Magnetococcales bacterium]
MLTRQGLAFLALLGCLVSPPPGHAGSGGGISLDGSMNPGETGPLSPGESGAYDISSDMGRQEGSNLFHSFSEFNLEAGQTASFSGADTITHIISRVTGGNDSWIDGTIKSSISGADFYLINPNGIIFGKNGSIDISGSFHAATADYLELGANDRLYIALDGESIFSTAAPAEFGFLSEQPEGIGLEETNIKMVEGESITFSGGDIVVNGGHLEVTEGGGVGLSAQGDIQLTGATINNFTQSARNGGSVVLEATGEISINAGQIEISTYDAGQAGSAIISGDSRIIFDNDGQLQTITRDAGDAGDITLSTFGSIEMSGYRIENVASTGSGSSGLIAVSAEGDLLMDSFSTLRSDSFDSGDVGGIDIDIGGELHLIDAFITSETSGSGTGASIDIDVGEMILMDDTGSISSTTTDSGQGGWIDIHTGTLRIMGGGDIHAESTSTASDAGDSGDVHISAERILMSENTSITTRAEIANGGDIHLTAGLLLHLSNSQIITPAEDEDSIGNGGDVTIDSTLAILDNSRINADANLGNGGDITITVDHMISDPLSTITASSELGINGIIEIRTPTKGSRLERSSVPDDIREAEELMKSRCQERRFDQLGSLVKVGKGDLMAGWEELLTAGPMDMGRKWFKEQAPFVVKLKNGPRLRKKARPISQEKQTVEQPVVFLRCAF